MTIILLTCRYLILRSCTSLNILVLGVDPGYPQGAPLQVNCVGVPLDLCSYYSLFIGARCELIVAAQG